jgi:hypothetical protein
MVDESLARQTYNMVLELHREWPEFKGAFLRLERRVAVLEDRRYTRSSMPPRAELEQYATKSGAYKIPQHELDALLVQHDKSERAAKWDASLAIARRIAVAIISTVAGAYILHNLWH